MGTSTNSWSDTGCGCQKTGTFVDYMPVVVNYTVTPTDYDVLGTSTCTDSSGVLGTSTGNGRGCRNSTSSGCC